MSLSKKYNYDISDMEVVKELPTKPEKYLYILRPIEGEWYDDKLYRNECGKLEIIAYKAIGFSSILLFLKKYRAHPELLHELAKNIKQNMPKTRKVRIPITFEEKILPTSSFEVILLTMQFMLTSVNTYEEFKTVVTKATKEIKPLMLSNSWGYGSEEYNKRLSKLKCGNEFIFLDSKDEMGIKKLNMNGDEIKAVPDCRHACIYHNKEENSYEVWRYANDDDTRGHAHYYIDVIFYEEKYLYEYLLNYTLNAVVS